MTAKPTDRQIIARALVLLDSGLLASALPGRLMGEFSLSPEQAKRLAQVAIRERRKRIEQDKTTKAGE